MESQAPVEVLEVYCALAPKATDGGRGGGMGWVGMGWGVGGGVLGPGEHILCVSNRTAPPALAGAA